jgi:hypothetical protein
MRDPEVHLHDPVSVIQEWWGDRLDERLLAIVAAAPPAQVCEFLDHYRTGRDGEMSSAEPGELRPFASPSTAPALALYAHRVVVPDPLVSFADPVEESRRMARFKNGRETPVPVGETVARALRTILELEPLHEIGALLWLPAATDAIPADHPYNLTYRWRVDEGERPEVPGWIRVHHELGLPRSAIAGYLYGIGLSAALLFPGCVQPPLWHPDVRRVATALGDSPPDLWRLDRRQDALQKLDGLMVPNMWVSTAKTAAALRQHSDAFARWRQDLSRVLDLVLDVPVDVDPSSLNDIRGLIHSELSASRNELEREVSRSRPLAEARKGLTSIGVGGLAAGATSLAGSGALAPSVAGVVTAAVAGLAVNHYTELRRIRSDKALLDAYLVFDEPPETI